MSEFSIQWNIFGDEPIFSALTLINHRAEINDIVGFNVFYNGGNGKTKSITLIEVYKRVMDMERV